MTEDPTLVPRGVRQWISADLRPRGRSDGANRPIAHRRSRDRWPQNGSRPVLREARGATPRAYSPYRVEPEIVTPNSAPLFCLLSAVADAFSLGQRRARAQSCGAPATGARGSDSSGRGPPPPIPAPRRLVAPKKSGFETDLWLRAKANVSAIPAVFACHGHQPL